MTEEGIEKNHQFWIAPDEIDLITQRTRESLAKPLEAAR